jgi:hypothetical protein
MPETEFDTFAGIDVRARELSVALCRGKGEDKPAMAKFSNHPSGHKALIAHLLRGGRRVRVCLEASGNYSLDLALTLQAHRQVEISVINPRRARRFAESLGQRSKTDPVDAPACSASMPLACLGLLGNRPAQSPYTCELWRVPLPTWGLSILSRTIVRTPRPRAKPCRSWWSRRCNVIRNILSSA